LNEKRNLTALNEYLLGLTIKTEQCLIKPDPCYDNIPIEVYQSMIERTPPHLLLPALALDTREALESLLSIMETRHRYHYSSEKANIDVFSKKGLLSFAKEGMISDHLSGLPPFDIKERKIIIQTLRDNLVDSSDGYRLYITEKDIKYMIVAYKNIGIYNDIGLADSVNTGRCENTFLQNKMLADVVFDYATSHVYAYHALPKEDAIKFLDGLIEKLCEEYDISPADIQADVEQFLKEAVEKKVVLVL